MELEKLAQAEAESRALYAQRWLEIYKDKRQNGLTTDKAVTMCAEGSEEFVKYQTYTNLIKLYGKDTKAKKA